MKRISITAVLLLVLSCSSYELKEPYKSDYKTIGPLGNNCFQIIIDALPDQGLKTMASRRESAYINARSAVRAETGAQIYRYYIREKNKQPRSEQKSILIKTFEDYTGKGRIVEEFYREDDSAVLIYRIFVSNVKNQILSQ